MKRECVQKFLSGFFCFCIALSFSFASFAAAFTGAYMTTETDPVTGQVTTVIKDVNPTGQTYSGQNVIEINAYNNAPTLTNNTFNGSTDINPDFTSITSSGNAYNGSVDINYDGLGGTLDSNGDRFQSTTVTAQQSDISISNGTFNGTTNINAQSVSLGSISQMDDLILQIMLFRKLMMDGAVAVNVGASQPYPTLNCTVTYNGQTITEAYPYYTVEVLSPNAGWTDLSTTLYRYRSSYINALLVGFTYTFRNMGTTAKFILNQRRTFDSYSMSIDQSGETFSLIKTSASLSFSEMVDNRFSILIDVVNFWFQRFFNWYYPLDNVLPEYWRYYNTDTGQQEEIGLAGLMYNISWYLGQMYVLQSASQSLDNMTDQVEAITDTLEEAEQKENAVISSISSGINSFAPDLTDIGAFKALSWTSNYLQQMFVSLGTYGTVILVGLLLGVCMQFIGYFKYK